ncbi:PPOX class F420-dependent oxidoreductase [Allokutzneria multivorans]|uniref:PPOX class F420-dependent oxidoreductase n=1 Tax=Allokutzneria multivorans TaxID=1142134 RepID=A0ABP7RI93_9PSEU
MSHAKPVEGWWKEFVGALPARTGKLAVVRKDGSPHVVPVWVAVDGDELVFMTGKDTVKGKAIARDGRVAICFDDERPPFDFVTVVGTATTSEDQEALLHWGTRIAARYMGEDLAEQYGKRNAVPGELLVRVRVDKLIGARNVAD